MLQRKEGGQTMDKRKIQLLKQLIDQKGQYETMQRLAEQLGCSVRTLRNDLASFSMELEERGFPPVERKPGTGVRLVCEPEQWKELMRWSWELERTTPLEAEERQLFVLYQLLMSKTPLTIDSLAREHYVSAPVIRQDLKTLAEICRPYQLTVRSIQSAGTTIEGAEVGKRALLSHTVKQLSTFSSKEKMLFQFFEPGEISVVEEAFDQLLRKQGLQFDSTELEGLKLHVLFTVKRLHLKQPVELPKEKVTSVRETVFYEWAAQLAKTIEEKIAVRFPVNELTYLALHFQSRHADQTLDDSQPQWVTELVQQLISEVADLFKLPLDQDQLLRENLMLHLITTASRLENGLVISNPLLKEIKKEYVHLFYFIQSVVESSWKDDQRSLPEEEIGYLTVHFQGALERQKVSETREAAVGIVCHYGVGVSAFIQARIESRFPEIERTVILPEDEVDTFVRTHPLAFILTTMPLEVAETPVLMISPLLHEEELEKVSDMLELTEQTPSAETPSSFSLLDYSQPFLIHLQKEFKTREEALTFMCREIIRRGYVEEPYLDTVLEREERASTAIGKGIALPHGDSAYVNQPTISCMTLKEPIGWGNESVSVLFLVAVRKEDLKNNDAKGFFAYVHRLMNQTELLQRMKNEQNVVAFLSDFGEG